MSITNGIINHILDTHVLNKDAHIV